MKKNIKELLADLVLAEDIQKYHLRESGKWSSKATLAQRGAQAALDAKLQLFPRLGEGTEEQLKMMDGVIEAFESDAEEFLRKAGLASRDAYGYASDKVREARLAVKMHIDSRSEEIEDNTPESVPKDPQEIGRWNNS